MDTEVLPRSVSGFGHLRVNAWLAAHRSLTQPSHVLHRLSTPEHPPDTLSNLTTLLENQESARVVSSDRYRLRDVIPHPELSKIAAPTP